MKKITKEIFVAHDGTEFLSEKECVRYEIEKYRVNMYEVVYKNNRYYLAVVSGDDFSTEIAKEWARQKFGPELMRISEETYALDFKYSIDRVIPRCFIEADESIRFLLSPFPLLGVDNINYLNWFKDEKD